MSVDGGFDRVRFRIASEYFAFEKLGFDEEKWKWVMGYTHNSVSVLPKREIISVTGISIHIDIGLSTVSIGKDNCNVCASDSLRNRIQVVVVADICILASVFDRSFLQGSVWSNKVRELSSSRSPAHSQSSSATTSVRARIWSIWVVMSILANHCN